MTDIGQRNTLEMAIEFASVTDWSSTDLKNTCQAVFYRTLDSDPTKRLRGGWSAIQEVLGHHK